MIYNIVLRVLSTFTFNFLNNIQIKTCNSSLIRLHSLYGQEMCIRDRAWVMTKKESSKIQSAKMQFLRNTLNYTLQDIIRNEDVRVELEVKDINEIISIYRRQWWDHLQRMTEDQLPKGALNRCV